ARISGCSFKHSSRYTYLWNTVWFTKGNDNNPDDLKTDPAYAGRVSYSSDWKSYTLTIRDLRESDSAVYKFRFETDWKYFTGLPGVTLTVTVLQVHVDTSSYPDSATLTCRGSCRLNNHLFYAWYKNGQKISNQSDQYWYTDNLNPSDSYSCAVTGHEDFSSPSVYIPKLPSVSVSPSAEIVEGSSVTLTCSSDANPAANYTWYKEQQPISQEKQIIFRSIWFSDSGKYCCTAENELGKTISKVISINVKCDSSSLLAAAVSTSQSLQHMSSKIAGHARRQEVKQHMAGRSEEENRHNFAPEVFGKLLFWYFR
uniref:Ig-like domain-containing protein n=1 Tax=Haplochromis burtoni TaxID=8153 RepID=A0A3Q3C6C4_HAPBU